MNILRTVNNSWTAWSTITSFYYSTVIPSCCLKTLSKWLEVFFYLFLDDDEDKKKLNIKKLMVMKQKGVNIDSSSERNLSKKWAGVNFTIINFDNMKFTIKKVEV